MTALNGLFKTVVSWRGGPWTGICDTALFKEKIGMIQHIFFFLFQENHTSWTHHSPECRLFDVLLTDSGPTFGLHLQDVMEIFTECLDSQKKDPELRLK